MNKKTRNALLIFFAFILIAFLPKNWFTGGDNKISYSKPDSTIKSGETERIDSIHNTYSNFKYGFGIDFPDNWNMRKGMTEHTLIVGEVLDSAITFSVNVIDPKVSGEAKEYTIWDLWDVKELNIENTLLNNIESSINQEINQYEFRKVYVSNWEAIECTYNYLDRSVDYQVEMKSKSYSIMKNGYSYTLGFSVPSTFYIENPDYYNNLVHKFIFMNPKSSS